MVRFCWVELKLIISNKVILFSRISLKSFILCTVLLLLVWVYLNFGYLYKLSYLSLRYIGVYSAFKGNILELILKIMNFLIITFDYLIKLFVRK